MPTVIREFARAKAGEVSVIAAGVFSSGELLTAVRNGSDNLELIVWNPDTLDRGDDSGTQALEVGEIALAMMGSRCVAAVQNANGKLLLIPWALEPDPVKKNFASRKRKSSGRNGNLPHDRTVERHSRYYCCRQRGREFAAHSLVRRRDDRAHFAAQTRLSTRRIRRLAGHVAPSDYPRS